MGAFAGLLGHAAEGFDAAHQQDLQRQFLGEMGNRQAAIDIFRTFALDPNQPDEIRNAGLQGIIDTVNTPIGKKFTLEKATGGLQQLLAQHRAALIAAKNAPPPPPQQTQVPGMQMQAGPQTPQLGTPPPAPFGPQSIAAQAPQIAMGGALNLPPTTTSVQGPPPPSPGSLFASPEQIAQNIARAHGLEQQAIEGATARFPVLQAQPNGTMSQVTVSGTGQPMGTPIPNVINPMMMRYAATNMHPITIVGPDGVSGIPAYEDKLGLYGPKGMVYDQNGTAVQDAKMFEPSLVTKQSTESMGASGAITRKTGPVTPKPQGVGTQPPTPNAAAPATSGGTRAGSAPPKPKGSPETSWENTTDPVAQLGIRWATQGQKPAGGAMAERQVLNWMQKHGLQPALPVSPTMQQHIQELFVARNSAINLIDDIVANKNLLQSLLSSGKIAIASNPDGSGIMQRAANLNDQESRVAGDFQQLIEHANLLRGPLGATGFRGKEAWGALQAQRGKPLGDPRQTLQILGGMRDRLVGLNNADRMVLGGQGMSGAAADPYEGREAEGPNGHRIIWRGGQWLDKQNGSPIQP